MWQHYLVEAILAQYPNADPSSDFSWEIGADGTPNMARWNKAALGGKAFHAPDWQKPCEALARARALERIEAASDEYAAKFMAKATGISVYKIKEYELAAKAAAEFKDKPDQAPKWLKDDAKLKAIAVADYCKHVLAKASKADQVLLEAVRSFRHAAKAKIESLSDVSAIEAALVQLKAQADAELNKRSAGL